MGGGAVPGSRGRRRISAPEVAVSEKLARCALVLVVDAAEYLSTSSSLFPTCHDSCVP